MDDFDAYWDTRIDANLDFFQGNPNGANWAYSEARLAYETGQESGDSFKLAESERHRQILTQQCMEKNARIADLERQLEELREAARNFLEIVRMPTNAEEFLALAEVERLLEEK